MADNSNPNETTNPSSDRAGRDRDRDRAMLHPGRERALLRAVSEGRVLWGSQLRISYPVRVLSGMAIEKAAREDRQEKLASFSVKSRLKER